MIGHGRRGVLGGALGRALGAALVLLLVAACSPGPTPTPTPQATNPLTQPARATNPPTTATQSVGPPSTSPSTSTVVVDSSLLRVLPASVDGLEVIESSEGEATALVDPNLAAIGTALAAGIAVDGPTGQFVYAVVVRLGPGAMNNDVFRDWRASYDDGACSQADGVATRDTTEIGGRTVYIGTCTGNLRTYHVWLESQAIVIAVSAVGDRQLGEHLLEALHP